MGRLTQDLDVLLKRAVTGAARVPGVVAMATDQSENFYEGAAGERILGSGEAMTADTVLALNSMTKAITATAALQCVEERLLDLDRPAKDYVPDIGKLQVIGGFDDDGEPRLRPPRREVTTRMLMLHTAGFGYNFFNANYNRLVKEKGVPVVGSETRAALMTPLLFDPGDKWEYGTGMDWCGLVVEAVREDRLGEVMRERIFEPLGMHDTAFRPTPAMRPRLARMHRRGRDGSLAMLGEAALDREPEVQMGGHGLYGTAGDYMAFIRMWLNDGIGPAGRVLTSGTVRAATEGGLGPHQAVTKLPGVVPAFSHDVEFFPGLRKSWSLGFMINEEEAPTGRAAGSLAWAGLANLYYWIDRSNGIGGLWATQLFPFADATCMKGFEKFESAVYRGRTVV